MGIVDCFPTSTGINHEETLGRMFVARDDIRVRSRQVDNRRGSDADRT